MSKQVRMVRGERQRELVKLFDGLCDRHNRWQVWSDFITVFAISISNVVDRVHAEDREKTYMTLIKRYSDKELSVFPEMMAHVVTGMEENMDQDFLGEMFMNLNMGNEHAGQFFTPYTVCKFMAKMNEPDIKGRVAEKGYFSVCDPTCGAGALLVAFANECLDQKVNYQTSVLFVAQDIDYVVGMMCYIQLSLIGAAGYVKIGNTLTDPLTTHDPKGVIPVDKGDIWYTPFYFLDVWDARRRWAMLDIAIRSMASLGAMETPTDGSPLELPTPPEIIEEPEPFIQPVYAETATGQLTFF